MRLRAGGEDDEHRFGGDAPRDEGECAERRLIDQVRVVDEDGDGLGDVSENAEERETDLEAVGPLGHAIVRGRRGRRWKPSRRRAERVLESGREHGDLVGELREHEVDARIRQVRLGREARHAHDAKASRMLVRRERVQEGGLADPRLAADDDRSGATVPRRGKERPEGVKFPRATEERSGANVDG